MTRKNITRNTVAIVWCTLFLQLLGCSPESGSDTNPEVRIAADTIAIGKNTLQNLDLTYASAEQTTMSTEIRAIGIVHVPPQFAYSITTPFGGTVRHTTVLPGGRVVKGQALLTIENPEFITLQQEYLSTVALLRASESELERQQRLAKDSVTARRKLETAEAETQTLRVRRKALAEKLALINIDTRTLTESTLSRTVRIPSPIHGYVASVSVNNGSYIAPNTVMMELVDTDHMHIELQVFERDILRVQPNQKVLVRLTDSPSTERDAHVHLIGKEVGKDRTIVVHAHLNTPDPTILPGTTLTASIMADQRLCWTVPEASIVSYNGRRYVFTGNEGTFIRHEVQTGTSEKGRTELVGTYPWLMSSVVVASGAQALLAVMVNTD